MDMQKLNYRILCLQKYHIIYAVKRYSANDEQWELINDCGKCLSSWYIIVPNTVPELIVARYVYYFVSYIYFALLSIY